MAPFFDLLFGNSLTRLVLFPVLACLPLFFLREDGPAGSRPVKIYALVASLVELILGVVFIASHWSAGGFPLVRDTALDWIPSFGIRYELAMDGISMPLVVLTVFLLPLVLLGSWRGITRHWRAFAAANLLLTTGMLGAFLAFDLFVFYIFWEIMLVPMYLIIGIWGGERRIYAAIKFFLYTLAGSLLMLVAILWLAWTYQGVTGQWSFSYEAMMALGLPAGLQYWLFGAFAAAFLIKVPVFPVHTWLPDAHVEAPTGGSVVLAGVLLKLGTYGLLRFGLPLFPHASDAAQPLLVALALVGILYGALVAWVQVDMKKLVAYSSIAHLGFVVLGLAAADLVAWQGSLIQMINHGLSTGALFLLVGMLYDRRHTKKFEDYSGLAAVMPVFAFFLVFSTLASVGLPGLNGFVGEFLILIGSYRELPLATAIATFGVVLAAVYLMKLLYRTVWGPLTHEENKGLEDLNGREIATLVPLAVLMLWIGLAPQAFLAPSTPALEDLLTTYQERVEAEPPSQPRLAWVTNETTTDDEAPTVVARATPPPDLDPDPSPPSDALDEPASTTDRVEVTR